MSGHRIDDIYDFGVRGSRTVCTCGWMSSRGLTLTEANAEFATHRMTTTDPEESA